MHAPVLVRPVVDLLVRHLGKSSSPLIIDATFGAGGYTRALLSSLFRSLCVFDVCVCVVFVFFAHA